MNAKPIVHLVMDLAYFFDTASDDLVHPDVAVQEMEDIAATLRGISSSDRENLDGIIRSIIKENEGSDTEKERLEFYRKFFDEYCV